MPQVKSSKPPVRGLISIVEKSNASSVSSFTIKIRPYFFGTKSSSISIS